MNRSRAHRGDDNGSTDPPDFLAPPSRPQRVDDAHGVVRDALAALSNLETLLRSPRVGPRALQDVLPDLRYVSNPVRGAVALIARHLSTQELARAPADALLAYVDVLAARLAPALERAASIHLGARERLALEDEVGRGAAELRSIDELLRLLRAATEARPTELDLREVIEQAFIGSRRSGPPRRGAITAMAVLPDEPLAVYANANVVMPLIGLAVAIVHQTSDVTPSLAVECAPGSPLVLVVSDHQVEGDCFLLHPPELVPAALSSAEAAARIAGGSFTVEDDGRRVVLDWPRA